VRIMTLATSLLCLAYLVVSSFLPLRA